MKVNNSKSNMMNNNNISENRCNVYVMAPLDVINEEGKPSYLNKFSDWCSQLKEGGIDGVMIDVWWGLVEKTEKKYRWSGYDQLFKVMHKLGLKILPVLSFHQCSGNIGDTVHIPIPKFVFEHEVKPYFVDRFNQINDEYISFSYDNVKLGDRTPLEMYSDFMINFNQHFQKYIKNKTISKIEVGLGPCGELRYQSYLLSRWEYPASGSFQCYDEMFKEMFIKDAKEAGHSEWTSPPTDIGDNYNVYPGGSTFWSTGYKTEYGKFFLSWYSEKLIEHGRNILRRARKVFPNTEISGKVAGIHWQYLNETRSAEATAGYYNTNGNDGYSKIAKMFKEEDIDFCFTCLEMRGEDKYSSSAPESLVNDVFETATKNGLNFEGENAIECYDSEAYNQILKWKNKGMREFTFLRMTDKLMNNDKIWTNFVKFTEQMHYISSQDDDEEEDSDSYSEKEGEDFIYLNCEYNLL
ncbi:beta-amylase [Tritrichomonas musculus]|uniref:Beta-amylase n=1 Tax=Tritrichomonas musculus TaxID=1915356 RepID=A0ABR2L5W0_9EUKA